MRLRWILVANRRDFGLLFTSQFSGFIIGKYLAYFHSVRIATSSSSAIITSELTFEFRLGWVLNPPSCRAWEFRFLILESIFRFSFTPSPPDSCHIRVMPGGTWNFV